MKKLYSKDEVEKAVKESSYYSEVFKKLGLITNGGSYPWLKKLIQSYDIDTSHFLNSNLNLLKGAALYTKENRDKLYGVDELKTDSRISSQKLRSFLKYHGIVESCSVCGISEWRGNKLRLDVDHIDENPLNNKLSNLQFMCPNCHRSKTIDMPSQRQKSANKAVRIKRVDKKISYCICGNTKKLQSNFCRNCSHKIRRKVERPSNEDLLALVNAKSLTQIGKDYGVSANTVKKWLKVI